MGEHKSVWEKIVSKSPGTWISAGAEAFEPTEAKKTWRRWLAFTVVGMATLGAVGLIALEYMATNALYSPPALAQKRGPTITLPSDTPFSQGGK